MKQKRLFSRCLGERLFVQLLLFFTRKYTIINANLEVISAKIHSIYLINIH